MHIIQVASTGELSILENQINYLFCNIVGIGGDFLFFHKEFNKFISIILNQGKCFIPVVSIQLLIIGVISVEGIVQNSFSSDIL